MSHQVHQLGILSVCQYHMANSLIAVVSYSCIARYACTQIMEYALPPLTTCTAYLHIICCIISHSMCHFHTQPVSYCKTMQDYVTQLCQSSMLKLALFPGSQSAFCWYCHRLKEGCLVYTLPIPSLAKQLHTLMLLLIVTLIAKISVLYDSTMF